VNTSLRPNGINEPDRVIEPAPVLTAEPQPGIETGAEPVPAAPVEPEPEAMVETEAETPQAASEPEPTSEPEPALEVSPEPEAEVEVEVSPEPEAEVESPAETPQAAVSPEPAIAPTTVPAMPEATTLVPLEDIAPAIVEASLSRRAFLGFGLALAGGLAGAGALFRLFPVFQEDAGASPIVPAYDPASKAWTFVVDTAACIGCGLCVVACKEENDVPEEAAYTRTWVERHVTTADGARYVDSPDAGMNGFPPESTAPGAAGKAVDAAFFEPRLCMQCEDSPCTAVCPVGATYTTADGVVLVDSRRCIGCGYCVVACPYGARYLVPAGPHAPNDTPGVADKCTWCYHRISRGGRPACVEACPVGARRFGDASDPNSEIATFVRERNPQQLHPEYGTRPRVLYLGPAIEEA